MTPTGEVVLAGDFTGMVNVGGSTLTSMSGTRDFYVARYDGPTGAALSSKHHGGLGAERPHDIKASGPSLVVTGEFDDIVGFGGAVLTTAGGEDAFVAKFNSADGHQLSTRIGGTANDVGHRVSVHGNGAIEVAGQFGGAVNFGEMPLTSNGGLDAFVVGVDGTSGVVASPTSVGGPGADDARDVATSNNAVAFVGSFSSSDSTCLGRITWAWGPQTGT